ncbi:MAG: heparinase II/III family protein [Rhodospirillales bacterium]|nr:heparinase II/III family protein [Rhodospirillales bacterium]
MTAAALFFASPLYRWTLAGRAPATLARRLPVRWPGDVENGRAILGGELRLAGKTIRDPAPLWTPSGASEEFRAELHGFTWLADLIAAGGAAAARAFVRRWIEENSQWDALAWRSDVVGARLAAWIAYSDELGADASFVQSVTRQATHLARVVRWESAGAARIAALKGLIFAALALGWSERRLHRIFAQLERELASQIAPDGGHVERSPALLAQVLRDLVDVRTALRASEVPLPEGLQGSIDRLAPMLRFFRHGDGRLAQFEGSVEETPIQLDLLLARSEAKGRAPQAAPHSGWQRLVGGKTAIVVDTGLPASHAGTLAFEMSHGKERVVVNCGGFRQTAAHSTLVVEDTNSSELRADGRIGRRPTDVLCGRDENEEGQWIEARHDGYDARFGLVHTRRLFLTAAGDELRGEDRLSGNRAGAEFAVRFHLHPAVQVSLIQEGAAALLKLPSGIGWRLRVDGAALSIAESVYCPGGSPRKTQQLVLSGQVGREGASVLWSIRREGRRPAES